MSQNCVTSTAASFVTSPFTRTDYSCVYQKLDSRFRGYDPAKAPSFVMPEQVGIQAFWCAWYRQTIVVPEVLRLRLPYRYRLLLPRAAKFALW